MFKYICFFYSILLKLTNNKFIINLFFIYYLFIYYLLCINLFCSKNILNFVLKTFRFKKIILFLCYEKFKLIFLTL